ncbi:MAG: YbbC/YhhH family protein [Ignavibacteriaceae bacterium]|jgi:hypothetical protein
MDIFYVFKRWHYALVIFLCLSFSFITPNYFTDSAKDGYIPKDGYVPNAETAIKIAEAVWQPIYGQDIYSRKPFKATLINGHIWQVTGTLRAKYDGGVPYAEIEKKDCRIIKVYHSK